VRAIARKHYYKYRIRCQDYERANRKHANELRKIRRAANPEKYIAKWRAWYEKNKGKQAEYNHDWQLEHRKERNEYEKQRRLKAKMQTQCVGNADAIQGKANE
jgi:hypothetical protein